MVLKHRFLIGIILIMIVAAFLRFYNLSSIPNGLYQDETAIGYNAYSILKTGSDEYGVHLPLYFKSFGDNKLPVYIYLTALSELVFGMTAMAVRFPSALLGTLSVLVLYFFVRTVTKKNTVALVAAFLLAINPWSLQFSRAGFEVNVALFFALLGSLMFVYAVKSKYSLLFLFVSVISFGLSLYSYNVTRILAPLLFTILVFYYSKEIRQKAKRNIVIGVFLCILIVLPFVSTILGSSGAASAKGALITSTDIEAKSLELRSYLSDFPPIIPKLFLNKGVVLLWQYSENIISILSPRYFYVDGSPHGNQGIGTFGMFYTIEFPLLLLGLVMIFKQKDRHFYVFTLWGLACILILALSKEVPHATRGYFLLIPMIVCSAYGFTVFMHWLLGFKNRYYRWSMLAGISIFAFLNIFYYFTSYYFRFPAVYAKEWRIADRELSQYLNDNEKKYDKVIFDKQAGFVYTSLLFYLPYSPEQFQKTVQRGPDDDEGFSEVHSFGKYEFRDIDWSKDYKIPHALIVTTPSRKPNEIPPLQSFYLPKKFIVLSVKEKLVQYPIEDIMYTIVDTNRQ